MGGVGFHSSQRENQNVERFRQRRCGPNILGDKANIKGTGPGFETGKDVNTPDGDGGHAGCQRIAGARLCQRGPAEGPRRRKHPILGRQVIDHFLLSVDTHIHLNIFLPGQLRNIGIYPVSKGGIFGEAIVFLGVYSIESAGKKADAHKESTQRKEKPRTA